MRLPTGEIARCIASHGVPIYQPQSYNLISCYGNSVERTNEMAYRIRIPASAYDCLRVDRGLKRATIQFPGSGPTSSPAQSLQRGTADAEIEDSSVEIPELKGSPFEARSRSVYSHACYAYCQGFLPCYFIFRSSQPHLCWLWLTPVPV